MELSKKDVLPLLLEHFQLWSTSDDNRWSFTLRPNQAAWTQSDFERTIQGLRSLKGFTETVLPDRLEVVVGMPETATPEQLTGLILNVRGTSAISQYCYAETTVDVPHEFRTAQVHLNEQLHDVFPVQLLSTVKEERVLNLATEPARWGNLPKYYSLIKEFSYTNSKVTYTLTMSRSDPKPNLTMKESQVTVEPVDFEFAMEVHDKTGLSPGLGPDKNKTKASNAFEAFLGDIIGNLVRLVQLVRRDPLMMTADQRSKVITGYKALIASVLDQRAIDPSKPLFLTPKPVTLESRHLLEPGSHLGVTSIQTGYVVTDKADGERMLYYFGPDRRGYLISNTFDVVDTGLLGPKANTLIDGEWLKSLNHFAGFDVYFSDNQNFMSRPLIPNRNDELIALMNQTNQTGWKADPKAFMPLTLSAKRHIRAEGADMFKACREILAAPSKWAIDGLVFTPADLPVFSFYKDRPVKIGRSQKWEQVFKWKPPDQNSIDFLVEVAPEPVVADKDPETGVVTDYRQFTLSTGYNALQQETISPMNGLRMRYDPRYKPTQEQYLPRVFQPSPAFEPNIGTAWVRISGGRCLTSEGEPIEGNQIVEWSYNNCPKIPVGLRWVPMRIRRDKTAQYLQSKSISGTANDYSTAMNIWRNIHDPVSRAAIQGETALTAPKSEKSEDKTGKTDKAINPLMDAEEAMAD